MKNLLEETLQIMDDNNLHPYEILWLGCNDFQFTWEEFKTKAEISDFKHKYELPLDLVIMGNGWWMEIDADPESEDIFIVYEYPKRPQLTQPLKCLCSRHSATQETFCNLIDMQQ